MTLLRRLRTGVPGAGDDLENYAGSEFWASPGEYLRHSTLDAIARRLGHYESFKGLQIPIGGNRAPTRMDEVIASVVEEQHNSKRNVSGPGPVNTVDLPNPFVKAREEEEEED